MTKQEELDILESLTVSLDVRMYHDPSNQGIVYLSEAREVYHICVSSFAIALSHSNTKTNDPQIPHLTRNREGR